MKQLLSSSFIENIYGMQFGIEGFMQEWLFDLGKQPRKVIEGLRHTPSSALGSSRHKVQEKDLPLILNVLKKFNIRYFFLIGGNDTMDTIHRVEEYCRKEKYELTVSEYLKLLIMIFSVLTILPVLPLPQGQIF